MEGLEQLPVKRTRYDNVPLEPQTQQFESNLCCTPIYQKRLQRTEQGFDALSLGSACCSGETTPKSSPSSVKGLVPEQQQCPFEQLSLDEDSMPFPHSGIELAILSLFKPSTHEETLNKITNIRAKVDFYLDLNQNYLKTLEIVEGIEKEEMLLFDKLNKLLLKQSSVREINQSEVLMWQSEIVNSFDTVWKQLEEQSKETLRTIIATHKSR